MTDTATQSHSRLSPSARNRWGKCPASVQYNQDNKSSEASIDGTHSHTLLEHCVKQLKIGVSDPMGMVGLKFTDHEGEFKVDFERAKRVKIAVDYLKERLAFYGKDCTYASEYKVNPEHLLGRNDMGGTLDLSILSKDMLEVIDYKDGMGVVEIKGNPQLEIYAVSVLSSFLKIGAPVPPKIRMTVIQPKLGLKGMEVISSIEVNSSDLISQENIDKIKVEAAATDVPEPEFVPGDGQCKFCAINGNCPAMAKKAMESIGVMFSPIKPVEIAHQSATNQDPSVLSNERLQEIMEAAPLIRSLLDAVAEEIEKRLKAGQKVPGFKLVRGRGSREWKYSEEEIIPRLTKMGIPKSEVYVSKFVSPAQAEKLVWTKKSGELATLGKNKIELLNREYVEKSQGAVTIAPESDSRETVSIAVDVKGLFKPVAQLPSWLRIKGV